MSEKSITSVSQKREKENLEYLLDVIETQHLNAPCFRVCIKNLALLRKHFPNCENIDMPYSRMIKRFIELGVVIDIGDYFKKKVKCRNYDLDLEKLEELCQKHGIQMPKMQVCNNKRIRRGKRLSRQVDKVSPLRTNEVENIAEKSVLLDKIRFGRVNLNSKISDDQIDDILHELYPSYSYAQELADKLNANPLTKNNNIIMRASIHRGRQGNVYSIGIRAFTTISYLTKEENLRGKSYIGCREYYLKKYLQSETWSEFDVKGSVPKVARFVHTGEWLSDEIDPYEEMFQSFDFSFFGGENRWCKKNREIAKSLFMLLYFGGTPKQIANSRFFEPYMCQKSEIVSRITPLKQKAMEYCGCGDKKDTTVFLHESAIYLKVMKVLADRGIKVLQVYDAFFTRREDMPYDLPKIIKRCALDYGTQFLK